MKKCSSVVWQFFDRIEENNRCLAVLCKLCDCEYKYFGNTTNLRAHLMKKHPIQWEMRQSAEDVKTEEPKIRHVMITENSSAVASSKRRKPQRANKDNNVDVLENHDDNDDDEVGTTNSLIEQLHNEVSDEEWLEEDYHQIDTFDHKRKKIKREVVTPTRQQSSYVVHNPLKSDVLDRFVLSDAPAKDEYSVFGDYIANKLRKFRTPRTRGNIQQLITTILWQAEYGLYDDAEAVKRVLMGPIIAMSEAEEDNAPKENNTKGSKQEMSENIDS